MSEMTVCGKRLEEPGYRLKFLYDTIDKVIQNDHATIIIGKFLYDTIDKVIQNDHATIIIGRFGNKTVVKARGERYDADKGLLMCLLRHLVSSKDYHDIIYPYRHAPKMEKRVAKGVLTYILGKRELERFMDRWGER